MPITEQATDTLLCRTTKGAHKLKVLPEQPEETSLEPGSVPEDERGEGSGSGNDELELDDDEEDAPVRATTDSSAETQTLILEH